MVVCVYVCVCERERMGGEEVAVVRSVVGSVVGGYIVFTIPIIKCVCVSFVNLVFELASSAVLAST